MIYPLVSVVIPCFNHESFVKDSKKEKIYEKTINEFDNSYKKIFGNV